MKIEIPYYALPAQGRFHDSPARFKVLTGPVGTGKSMALCQEALKLAALNAGRLGLIGAPTYAMLRDSTQRQFLKMLEETGLRYRFHRAENSVRRLENGSQIIFRSLDRPERLRGPNLAWFGVDELTYTEAAAWLRLEARLRDSRAVYLCGFGVFTPKGFDWVYEKFGGGAGSDNDNYDLIQAAPFENRHVLDAVPDFYERLEKSYDAKFYEQEVLGRFLNTQQGRAYYAFSRAEHVRAASYDSERPLHWSWDFNLSPMSSAICQRSGDEVRVIDEIVLPTSSTPEVCREFLSRWGHHAVKPAGRPYATSFGKVYVYGDASGAHLQTSGGRSDYSIIRDFFRNIPGFDMRMIVPSANPPVRDRVNTLNARLTNARGERNLYIDPRCKELIADLEQVVYKSGSSQLEKDADSARTHLSDALGYYLWQDFRLVEPIGDKSRRLPGI